MWGRLAQIGGVRPETQWLSDGSFDRQLWEYFLSLGWVSLAAVRVDLRAAPVRAEPLAKESRTLLAGDVLFSYRAGALSGFGDPTKVAPEFYRWFVAAASRNGGAGEKSRATHRLDRRRRPVVRHPPTLWTPSLNRLKVQAQSAKVNRARQTEVDIAPLLSVPYSTVCEALVIVRFSSTTSGPGLFFLPAFVRAGSFRQHGPHKVRGRFRR